MAADRDFLFGHLAIQAGYVTPLRSADANARRLTASGESLRARLLSEGLLTEQQANEIDRRVEMLAETAPSVPVSSIDAPTQDFATDAPPSGADKSNPGKTARSPADSESAEASTLGRAESFEQVVTIDRRTDNRSRYSLTREHGRGGLGRVWLARDMHLNREVALKELLPNSRRDERRLSSLVREAQITGQLEHPNIVPVYELSSETGDRNPFYTMRFLRGATLSEHLKDYHRRRSAGVADSLEFRKLLDAFVGICEAMAYAHSRGVIHRDLKPSNVLLGNYGEVVVVDWGLAKKLSESRDDEATVEANQIVVADAGSMARTMEGEAMGTPAYMAPEQASGRLRDIDALTDVYGLGAILFAILTGQAPHRSERGGNTDQRSGTLELLRRIGTNPTPRTREVFSDVPPALDAICGKAMARERAERYANAADLARDVERWLADEPVTAHAEAAHERVFRWMRRHRAWTLSFGASLGVLALAATVIAVVTMRANARVSVALSQETQAREAAQVAWRAEQAAKQSALAQFRRAQDAIDRSLTGVSEVLEYFPGTQSLRTQLLQKAAEDYERLVEAKHDDADLRREAARTRVRLGDARKLLQDFDDSLEHYRGAEEELKKLSAEPDASPELRLELAQLRAKQAALLTAASRHEEAEASFRDAIADLKALSESSATGTAREARLAGAGARLNRSMLLRKLGRTSEAADELAEVERTFAAGVAAAGDLRHREGLAMTRRELGQLLLIAGRPVDAVRTLRDAVADGERLLATRKDHPPDLENLAATRILLANALRPLGDDAAAVKLYAAASTDYHDLLAVRPGIPAYRASGAAARVNVAQLLLKVHRSREAREVLDKAVGELIDLADAYPEVAAFHEAKAQCFVTLGIALRDLDKDELARTALEGARDGFDALRQQFPEVPSYRAGRAIAVIGLARTAGKRGARDEAESMYDEAARELQAVVESDAGAPLHRDALAWCHTHWGASLASGEKDAAAALHFERALQLRKELPDVPDYRRSLVALLSECESERVRDAKRAVALARELAATHADHAEVQSLLAAALLRNGEFAEAERAVRLAMQLRGEGHPQDLFVAAIAQQQGGHVEEARQSLAQALALFQEQCPGRLELVPWAAEARRVVGP